MIYVLLVVALILGFFLLSSRKKSKNSHIVKALPGWPVLGSFTYLLPENLVETCATVPLTYGAVAEFSILGTRGYLVSDAELAREILSKRPKKVRRTALLDFANDILQLHTGLFGSEGAVWQRVRKQTSPSFSNAQLAQKTPALANEIFDWIQRIYHITEENPKKSIDLKIECFSLTIRIITVVAFGLDIDDPLCAYFFTQFAQDMSKIFIFLGESALYPFPRWTWKYTSKYQIEVDARAGNERVQEASRKIIEFKRKQFAEGTLKMNCMIDALIANTANAEKAMTDEEIIANITVFYMAGADTTAITLSWLCYFFANQPEIVREVEAETKKVFLKGFDWQSLNSSDSFEEVLTKFRSHVVSTIDLNTLAATELPYLHAVVRESLRLGNPATIIGVESISEEPIALSNGVVIENKDIVFVNQDGIHLSPNNFDNPKEFNPNRWLQADEQKLKDMEKNFVPFGGGTRICPGMLLANNELYLAVGILSLFYSMSLDCPKEEIKRVNNFVTVPNKMPIIFHPKKSFL